MSDTNRILDILQRCNNPISGVRISVMLNLEEHEALTLLRRLSDLGAIVRVPEVEPSASKHDEILQYWSVPKVVTD